jgi:hypothetical protein
MILLFAEAVEENEGNPMRSCGRREGIHWRDGLYFICIDLNKGPTSYSCTTDKSGGPERSMGLNEYVFRSCGGVNVA